MPDSKDYFDALEPKPTPKVEVLAADLAELHELIRAYWEGGITHPTIRQLYKIVLRQQRIEPRL